MASFSYQENNGTDDNNDDNNKRNNNGNSNNDRKENTQKKGKGCQKISMQRIENDTNRQVTFSKRRGGLFKKSSELSTLCGSNGTVVVFSPSEKAHSFGSPNVESVTNRFHGQAALGVMTRPNDSPASQNNPIANMRNQELTELERQLEQEKQRKRELNKMKGTYQPNYNGFTHEQLNDMKEFMLHFKHAFEAKVNVHDDDDKGSKGSRGRRGSPTIAPSGDVGQLWDYEYPTVQDNQGQNNSGQPEYHMDDLFRYPNNVFPDPDTMFFPNMETSDNRGFIDPLDPSGNNFGYPYQNPSEASSSHFIFPNNYGYPNEEDVPDEGVEEDASDEVHTSTDEEEDED